MEILDKILNGKLLNYNKLNELFKYYINEYKKGNTVNIFIDVWDWIKPLYNPDITNELNSLINNERYTIASHIINIISHYRHYFATRYEMYTNFYFILSTEKCDEILKIFPEYKKDFYEKRLDINHSYFGLINKIINTNFKICKYFIEYVPHAYWIDTKKFSPLGMYNYIIDYMNNSGRKDELKIVISNDDYLLTECVNYENTIILQSRSQKSRIYYKDNVLSYFSEDCDLMPESISYILSLSSNKNYNLKGIKNMGYKRSISFINKNNSNLEYLINCDKIKKVLKNEEFDTLINKMTLLPINQFLSYYNVYKKIFELSIIDRVDIDGIRKVNNEYFSKEPVLIEYCFEGEEY